MSNHFWYIFVWNDQVSISSINSNIYSIDLGISTFLTPDTVFFCKKVSKWVV